MTVVVEGKDSFFFGSQATLVPDDREMAWAERTIRPNPALKWILGKYVEANKANNNNQFWALDQLVLARPTIMHAPLNMLHAPRSVVGTYVDTEIMYPTEDQASEGFNPYIEALAAFYRFYFPDELKSIEAAHATGQLFMSMECVAASVTCSGEEGCGKEHAYEGPASPNYCYHLNTGVSVKQLNKPHFLAGALIIPPVKPGWNGAEVKDISGLVKEHQVECEMAYAGIQEELPDADAASWEWMMGALMSLAKTGEKPGS